MKPKENLTRDTAIFIGLALAGIVVAVVAQTVADAFAQTLMVGMGSAIFGSGLTFFLIQMSNFEK